MNFSSPKIEIGSIIITFQNNISGVTPKKLYIVESCTKEYITIRNDEDKLVEHKKIFFMEADVVYAILLLSTLNRLFGQIF